MLSFPPMSYAYTSSSKPMDSRSSSVPTWDPPPQGSARRGAGKCSCAEGHSFSSEAYRFAMHSFVVIPTTPHLALVRHVGQWASLRALDELPTNVPPRTCAGARARSGLARRRGRVPAAAGASGSCAQFVLVLWLGQYGAVDAHCDLIDVIRFEELLALPESFV